MKSLRHILLLVLLALASCQDILDKEPLGTLDADSFFQTADDVEQATNAAYGPLLFNNTNNNFYWGFAELCSDEAVVVATARGPALPNWRRSPTRPAPRSSTTSGRRNTRALPSVTSCWITWRTSTFRKTAGIRSPAKRLF